MAETTDQGVCDIELDRDKLLGFRHLAAFASRDGELVQGADAMFNKRGVSEVPPPTSPG